MFHTLIEGVLTKEECNHFIEKGLHQGLIEMKSSKIVNGVVYNENITDTKNNKRKGTYFIDETLKDNDLVDLSNKILEIINGLKIYNSIEFNGIPKYSFNEYSKGDFLNWHKDSHEIINGATITLIIQLNEDYIGGDIMYRLDDVEYKVPKKQGSIFIFESNLDHSVSELEEGLRYSMNVWPSKKVNRGML